MVRMAHRVRPDLQEDLFPITWDDTQELNRLETFASLLADALDEHPTTQQTARTLSWKRWCSEQLNSGAKQLCTWAKAKPLSLVSAVLSDKNPAEMEHRPAVVAQRCLDEWATVWQASQRRAGDHSLTAELRWRISPQEAEAIIVGEIRASLKKLSGPGREIDGWDKPVLAACIRQSRHGPLECHSRAFCSICASVSTRLFLPISETHFWNTPFPPLCLPWCCISTVRRVFSPQLVPQLAGSSRSQGSQQDVRWQRM